MSRSNNHSETWQDIDDGIQLAKLYFASISKVLWLLFAVLIALCFLLSQFIGGFWLVLIIWWLKPVYDRVILSVLGLFVSNQYTTLRNSYRHIARNIFNLSTIKDLTVRRVSLTRSFRLPVYQLEKNEGKEANKRFRVLGQNATASRAANLTFMALLIEDVIVITIISMLVYIIPAEMRHLIFDNSFQTNEEFIQAISFVLYLITISVTEPLYVASGFNLYLRRRMRLEAWDIEQVFRKMVESNVRE